jgi:hypothetical protein
VLIATAAAVTSAVSEASAVVVWATSPVEAVVWALESPFSVGLAWADDDLLSTVLLGMAIVVAGVVSPAAVVPSWARLT